MKKIRIAGIFFILLFCALFSIRLGLFERFMTSISDNQLVQGNALSEKETWMNVFQDNRKIGYSHAIISKTGEGYLLSEELFLRINTMGFAQDLKLFTKGTLESDLTLSTFDFNLSSGLFQFKAEGKVSGEAISVQTEVEGKKSQVNIPIKVKPHLTSGIIQAVANSTPEPGEEFSYSIFDPATMATMPIRVKVMSHEEIKIMEQLVPSTKIAIIFKGITQFSWIGDNGDVLKEEGMLGLSLVKTTKEEALFGLPIQASQDLTKVASVASNIIFDHPVEMEVLKVRISGIEFDDMTLEGGRQTFSDNLLIIKKESLSDFQNVEKHSSAVESEKAFLIATPFIQSDHPDIKKTVETIVAEGDTPLEKIKKIVAWIEKNIEKRPVLSLPDALSTLKNRVGDCNEHAVLTAAFSRAVGIPARVEAGLVYMNGRFYYHAWNRLFIRRWITADSVFGQVPADVTHIRFGIGAQQAQLDLLNLIDKVKVEVVDYKYSVQ